MLRHRERLLVQRRVRVGSGALVAASTIRGLLGHGVLVLTGTRGTGEPTSACRRAVYYKPVSIGDGAWLGARCTIFPGVKGETAVVGAAGTVMTRNTANTLVAGYRPGYQAVALVARRIAPPRPPGSPSVRRRTELSVRQPTTEQEVHALAEKATYDERTPMRRGASR